MSNKRRKTGDSTFVRVTSSKRPIDKGLIVVSQGLSTTQGSTGLVGATFPCTVTGIRWDLSFLGGSAAANDGAWAIIIVRDGLAASTMSLTDGASLYQPEQDVLAFGTFRVADSDGGDGGQGMRVSGSTKSMRKLMGGDAILFITLGAAVAGNLRGVVQLFCKS